ncbi:MAG: hypothetical protein KAT68_17225 [Bacteroidales bacterium]|nr:hypothetical protein [Bacteroidales bacterium]
MINIGAILAWIAYFFIGIRLIRFLFPDTRNKKKMFIRAYLIASAFVIIYHLLGIYLEVSSWSERGYTPLPGIFTIDGLSYHNNGKYLASNIFSITKVPDFSGWTVAWDFIIGINYAIFGVNTLVPKIFSVFVFSLAAIGFSELGYTISSNPKVAKKSYYLFIFFLPLLYYCATLLREPLLNFLIVMIIYSYLMFDRHENRKWFVLTISFSIILFFTRLEYFLILISAIGLVFIINRKISQTKKIIYAFMGVLIIISVIFSPLSRQLGLISSISGAGGETTRTRAIAISQDEKITTSGGYGDIPIIILDHPLSFAKLFIYSSIEYFLSPLPNKWMEPECYRRLGQTFFFSLFNVYFYLLLPATYFGIYYKIKKRKLIKLDTAILFVIISNIISLALILRSGRYSIPIFPFILLYSVYGLSISKIWKKHIPFIALLALGGIVFFTLIFDVSKIIQ